MYTELGCAIYNLLSVVDCELLIIDSDDLVYEEQMLPRIKKTINDHAVIPIPIMPSKPGEKTSVAGLIAISGEFYFRQIYTRTVSSIRFQTGS